MTLTDVMSYVNQPSLCIHSHSNPWFATVFVVVVSSSDMLLPSQCILCLRHTYAFDRCTKSEVQSYQQNLGSGNGLESGSQFDD